MKKYGYVRVSSRDQNPDRQLDALKELGIDNRQIYLDKLSGKDFSRPQYRKMLSKLRKGDKVVIMSIDRLGRNYNEILEQWRVLTREKKVDIEVIDMPLLNTDSVREGLTGVFISDLVLQILAYVAETERQFIRQRQAEGIAAAKARGVQFGRRPKEKPSNFELVRQQWADGNLSARAAAEQLGVAHKTFIRWANADFLEKSTLLAPYDGNL